MDNHRANSSEVSLLAGPTIIKITVVSPRGPFSNKYASLSVPKTRISLVNTSANSVVISGLSFDPLQKPDTGVTTNSNLAADPAQLELASGASVIVTISGLVPATPGIYTSILRVMLQEGAQLSMPVEINVTARIAWGFACMVFGLSLIGIINALDIESGIQGELRRALLARQDFHEFLQQIPPPQSRALLVETINHEFDAAIESLQKSRKPSFVDNRGSDAQEHLKTAAELTADLRNALFKKPRSSIEVDDLSEEWIRLKDHFTELSKLFLIPAPQGSSLAQRLGAFDVWAADRILRTAIVYYHNEFAYQVNHVHLLYAAGRDQDAANEATAVRRWMQRAADLVNSQAQTLMSFVQLSANNIAMAARVRQRLATEGIPPDQRTSILKSLDETPALLSDPLSWPVRRTVNLRIEEASTNTLRAEQEAVHNAMKLAVAQEDREDSIDSINAVINEGATLKRGADGKIDIQEKMAWQRRCLIAWRNRIATAPEPNQPAMLAELNAYEAAIASENIDAISAHVHAMLNLWTAYSIERGQSLISKASAPFCVSIRDDALISLESAQQTMRRLEGNPNLLKWEGEFDNLRMKIYATPNRAEQMSSDCFDVIMDLANSASSLSREITSAMWSTATLPDATKHELASDFSSILTPEALQDLISVIRPLHIDITTPQTELYVGHQINFNIANLAQAWGAGVLLKINFGDDQYLTVSGEELHKNPSGKDVADLHGLSLENWYY
jgi:hypothetical protein